ncbi:WXG100 family type VII secretion target [Ornithinibacillus halotolerans]|uniref:WXG100 family type VII secretion target n=1 Tax=Ornithinibacillus halotolerans TaxID=1274357 RepID=A0A916S1U2_9BACI|nr:WXG100 family type VII secretion target [Ornithinibacillus halotolerans]GGA79760.1 hypothetical protein GCM10008025_23950 [Ornithinibacillus halotolerans]
MSIVKGTIEQERINQTHVQIKEIVDAYQETNQEVARITQNVKENWVGEGRDEFETQYKLLISKIDDFGDALRDVYDMLVEAEAQYATADDQIRQQFDMAMEG